MVLQLLIDCSPGTVSHKCRAALSSMSINVCWAGSAEYALHCIHDTGAFLCHTAFDHPVALESVTALGACTYSSTSVSSTSGNHVVWVLMVLHTEFWFASGFLPIGYCCSILVCHCGVKFQPPQSSVYIPHKLVLVCRNKETYHRRSMHPVSPLLKRCLPASLFLLF